MDRVIGRDGKWCIIVGECHIGKIKWMDREGANAAGREGHVKAGPGKVRESTEKGVEKGSPKRKGFFVGSGS